MTRRELSLKKRASAVVYDFLREASSQVIYGAEGSETGCVCVDDMAGSAIGICTVSGHQKSRV